VNWEKVICYEHSEREMTKTMYHQPEQLETRLTTSSERANPTCMVMMMMMMMMMN